MKRLGEIILVFVFVAGLFSLQSCSKADDEKNNDGITKTETTDYLNLLGAFNLSDVDDALATDETGTLLSDQLKSTEGKCFTITRDKNDDGSIWPMSWTVDFGDGTCECACGHSRSGKIHVTLSAWWKTEGSLREISFDDFHFDGYKLEGTKTILNKGLNDAGNMVFEKKLTDGKITYEDGTSMSWSCTKEAEQIEGGGTFLFFDDVWSVTGSGSGVNIDGNNFKMTITSPLIYKNGCFYPVSGVITIETDGEETKTIDYGDGECDKKITVTVGDQTEEIEL